MLGFIFKDWSLKIPTYEFICQKCDKVFETVESIKEYDGDGECPICKNVSRERILSANIQFIGTKVESAEYNPAFGQVVKNKNHRNELAKERGLIEIGNEKPETVHKITERNRIDNAKRRWEKD